MRLIKKAVVLNVIRISNDVHDLMFTGFNGWSYEREQLYRRVINSVRGSVRNNIKP